ncbi:hypothetical protein CJF42_23000 [Pseudoalteromonas sp. NBT06-2]|nr:hypothetical protein CJF42_23000 [Pseudoalteromonas sp. NBT06-2]
MSRIRGPYVRFCERDEAKTSPYSIIRMHLRKNMKIKSLSLLFILILTLIIPVFASNKAVKIDKNVSGFHKIKEFSGTVLVAHNNKVIFEKAYGFANFEWEIKNTLDTKFRIGSIIKKFTAMLIMQ